MSFEFDEPEEVASPWLKNPGTYHFLIMDQETDPLNYEKTAKLPGIKLMLGVVGGTDPSQINKQWEVMLYKGTEQDTDNQRSLNNRRLNRLFLATCLKSESQPGKKAVIGDTSLLVGRQFIAQVETYTRQSTGKQRLSFTWDNIYHVDDPAVAAVPKNAEAIAQIPQELRRDAASFATVGPATQSPVQTQAAANKRLTPSDLLSASGSSNGASRPRADVSGI